jgi:hypothetical protein
MSTITINMTADDAERLATTSMAWGNDWAEQDGRFESVKTEAPAPSYNWGQAYWLEPGAAAQILFTSYLAAHGYECETVWDLADGGGYVVLTDWVNA